MKLSTLSFITAALTVVSLVVFVQENKRGTDLASGSDYIKGLDIEKTQKIVLSVSYTHLTLPTICSV